MYRPHEVNCNVLPCCLQGPGCIPGEVPGSLELKETPCPCPWGAWAMMMLKRCLWHIPVRTQRL